MSTSLEIKEILEGLRQNLIIGRDWGLEPPNLSPDALAFLEGKGASTPPSTLEELSALIGDCRKCRLWTGRSHIVFGEGSPSAKLVFIGEAPGKEEDVSGHPFVGDAGKLLTRIIQDGMKLKRDEVYVCNVVKCRPPQDRPPEKDEIVACLPFLREQLRILKPRVICGLGGTAVSALTGRECAISQERGTWFSYESIPFMPTLHPASILSNPDEERSLKKLVWEDVQKIMNQLGMKSDR